MCFQQNITVEKVKMNPSAVTFSRWLIDIWRDNWEQILVDTSNVILGVGDDIVSWKFNLVVRAFSLSNRFSMLSLPMSPANIIR